MRKDLQIILKNERGVALMMILTAIIILMAIYGEFTFESKISRIKATNILDRSQSKLLAESGLQLAMTRLKLYKEAYNYIQNNANAKAAVPAQLINQLWEVPFIYPIPVGKNAGAAFKDTVQKFQDDTLLEGEMKVSIQNVSGRMNLNLLRMDMTKYDPTKTDEQNGLDSGTITMNDSAIQNDVSIHQTLYFLLKRLVEEKKEKDEEFEDRYADINYQELITNLRYYTSDYQSLSRDPRAFEAESDFQKVPLTPKFGPLGSSSELYSIPGWNDELIELIQNEFSVYPSTQIDFNKLTANMFRILIPTASDDDIRMFFEYRDDPETPRFFNTLPDFKQYVVNQAGLVSSSYFDERMNKFQQHGITFGSNPNFFKIVSEGTYNRATYTLVAYVLIPKQQTAPTTQPTTPTTPGQPGTVTPNPGTNPATNPAANQNTQLLEPRIIEIQIN